MDGICLDTGEPVEAEEPLDPDTDALTPEFRAMGHFPGDPAPSDRNSPR